MEGKKKSKKGLLVGIIIAIVVAGGAVAAFFILNNGNGSENIVLDAVTKTIKNRAHELNGKLEFSTSVPSVIEPSVSNKTKIILDLESKNNSLNGASSATLTIEATGMSDFVFRFEEIFQDDGTFYVKPSDLTNFVNSIASTFSEYLSVEPLASIANEIKSLASKVSSNWWRISVPEVMKALGAKNEKFTDEYSCLVSVANELASESGLDTLADTYKAHQFLNVKKSDRGITSFTGDVYEAAVDTGKLAQFWNEYANSDKVKKLEQCAPDNVTVKTVSPEELSGISNQTIFLDIDKDHNLKGFYLNGTKDSYDVKADFRLEKGSEDLAFAAPSGAKPITDLTADIIKVVQSVMNLFSAMQTAE